MAFPSTSRKSNYDLILKSFGAFEIATVEEEEAPAQTLALRDIRKRPAMLSITHKLSTEEETHLDVS
jgi:hypothetical protein